MGRSARVEERGKRRRQGSGEETEGETENFMLGKRERDIKGRKEGEGSRGREGSGEGEVGMGWSEVEVRWEGGRCTGQRCHLIGCLAEGADCCFIPDISLHIEMFASARTYSSKYLATIYKCTLIAQ